MFIYPPPRLWRDGVLKPLPVRATSFLSYLLYLPTFLPLKGPEIRAAAKASPPSVAPLRLKLCEDVPPYLRNILSYFQLKTKGARHFNVMRFQRPAWGPAGRGLTSQILIFRGPGSENIDF